MSTASYQQPLTSRKPESEDRVQLFLSVKAMECDSFSFVDHNDALKTHKDLQNAQAESYKELNVKSKKQELKLGWKYRVAILKELIKARFEYVIKWGDRKHEHIKLDVGSSITDGQKQDMIDIMVDIETLIWQEKGLISDKLYNDSKRDTTKYLFSRSSFRTQRRELWQTAARNLQQQMDASFIVVKQPQLSKRYHAGGSRPPISNRLPIHVPHSASSGISGKKQLEQWQRRFAAMRKKLASGCFLSPEYHSARDVYDCPELVAEHRAKERTFINTNFHATCTGKEPRHVAYILTLSVCRSRAL
jgi:hypothetical protein